MGGIRWAVADWQEKLYNGMVTNQVSDTEKKTTSAQMLFKKKKKKMTEVLLSLCDLR